MSSDRYPTYLEALDIIADLEAKLAESEKEKQEFLIKYKHWKTEYEQLKQQLAEKGTDIAFLEATTCSMQDDIDYWENKVDQLEEKLAEKEEELKEFKSIGATPRQLQRAYQERYKYNERRLRLEEQLKKKDEKIKEYKRVCTISHLEDLQIENVLLKGKEQDKISFVVEQLEKVKEFCEKVYGAEHAEDVIEEYVDNQIKKIKGDEVNE